MAKTVNIRLDHDEHARLTDLKDGRTWREVLKDGAEVDQ